MGDVEQLINSQTLVSFQLDGNHLHAVLTRLAQVQDAQGKELSQVGRRLDGLESAVGELQDFARRMGGILDSLGSADEIRNLATHVRQIETRVETAIVPELQDTRRAAEDAGRRAAEASNVAKTAVGHAGECADAINGMREDVGQLSTNQRAFATDLRDATTRVDEVHRNRGVENQRTEELARQAAERVDRMERETLARLLRDVSDMNTRMDDNFKAVESAVVQFSDDSRRAKADIGNLRAELNALDNDASHRINKIKEDADGKFAMLLQLMQSFERNSQLFEAHMAEAGRVLAHPRAPSRAASEVGGSTPYRPGSTSGGLGGGMSSGARGGNSGGYHYSPQNDYAGTTVGRGDAEI
jgi:chromosome segregation ATPase